MNALSQIRAPLRYPESRAKPHVASGLDDAALHHRQKIVAAFETRDVRDDIAGDNQEVGEFSWLHGADLVAPAEDFSAGFGRAPDGGERIDADAADEEGEFAGVVARSEERR